MDDQLTGTIIGAAYKVHNQLGFGFLESVYEKAMAIELRKLKLDHRLQHPIKVHYDDEIVGEFFADVFVADTVIVELKSVQNLVKEHEVQLVNYLVATRVDVGLLINFGPTGVEIKRKFRNYKKSL